MPERCPLRGSLSLMGGNSRAEKTRGNGRKSAVRHTGSAIGPTGIDSTDGLVAKVGSRETRGHKPAHTSTAMNMLNALLRSNSVLRSAVPGGSRLALCLAGGMFALTLSAQAQIFTANAAGTNGIGAYGFDGSTINAAYIPNLSAPQGLAILGSTIFVANSASFAPLAGSIGAYNLDGSTVNASLVSNLDAAYGLAASNNTLFVSSFNMNTVSAYNATTGAPVGGFTTITSLSNPSGLAATDSVLYVSSVSGGTVTAFNTADGSILGSFSGISGLSGPMGLAVAGSSLFVANQGDGTIGKYDSATGSVIDADFISGLAAAQPTGLATFGNSLYITNQDGTVREYDLTSGAVINASLFSGLNQGYGIAVSAIPEPSTYAAIAGALMLGVVAWRRRTARVAA